MTETTENEKLESGEPLCPVKKTSIGGQALIEGVMMRGPQRTAMAVRHVSGEIVQESWPTSGQDRAAIWKVPFIRGIYNLVDSMRFGYKCLMRSAEMAGLEDEEDAPSKKKEAAAQATAQAALETEEAVETAVETELREALGSAADDLFSAPPSPVGQPTDESAVETASEITAPEPTEMPVSPEPTETEKAEKAEKKKNKAEDYLMSFLMGAQFPAGSLPGGFSFHVASLPVGQLAEACIPCHGEPGGPRRVRRGVQNRPLYRLCIGGLPDEGYPSGIHVPRRGT